MEEILYYNCRMCAASRQSSSRIKIIGKDMGGKDNKFLSFINKKRNESCHLIFWSLET